MNRYMKIAIKEAREGIKNGEGGPFGSVVVKNGKIVGQGHNIVLKNNNATCHGEIEAIKVASENLNTFDLRGCELYTTGEPCPMCLCACFWANIDKIYYGCTLQDNENIGFRDNKFNSILNGRENLKDYLICIDREECLKLYDEYANIKNKKNY